MCTCPFRTSVITNQKDMYTYKGMCDCTKYCYEYKSFNARELQELENMTSVHFTALK